MSQISERILSMSESATLAMTQKSRELQAQGLDIINLSIGEPDFNTPEHIKAAAIKAIENNQTHYPPVPGYPELRKAIVARMKSWLGLDYDVNQVIVSAGGKHSLINVILAVINKGDEVILPAPYWVTYSEQVKLAEGENVIVPTGIENDFKMQPEQLEAAINDKTRLLILCSPSNPTGSMYTRDELEACSLAQRSRSPLSRMRLMSCSNLTRRATMAASALRRCCRYCSACCSRLVIRQRCFGCCR